MGTEPKPKGRFKRIVTKNYWVSAIVCLGMANTASQTRNDMPEAQVALTVLLVEDLGNIAGLCFLVAGISRAIKRRREKK